MPTYIMLEDKPALYFDFEDMLVEATDQNIIWVTERRLLHVRRY